MTELEKENKDLKQRLTDVTNTIDAFVEAQRFYGNTMNKLQMQRLKDLESVNRFNKLIVSSF